MLLLAWQVMTAPWRSGVTWIFRVDLLTTPEKAPGFELLLDDGMTWPLRNQVNWDMGLLLSDSHVIVATWSGRNFSGRTFTVNCLGGTAQ